MEFLWIAPEPNDPYGTFLNLEVLVLVTLEAPLPWQENKLRIQIQETLGRRDGDIAKFNKTCGLISRGV